MPKRNLKDARKWLQESNDHYISNHDWGGTNKGSIEIVDELFEKGATKVEVDLYDEADVFTCEMAVTLPTDESKVLELLRYLDFEAYADSVEVETKSGGRAFVVWEN